MEMLLTGDFISAEKAKEIGLIKRSHIRQPGHKFHEGCFMDLPPYQYFERLGPPPWGSGLRPWGAQSLKILLVEGITEKHRYVCEKIYLKR